MNYRKEAELIKNDVFTDLKTLIKIKSVLDETTITKQQPYGKDVRAVLDAFLAMAKRDGFKYKDVDGHAAYIEYGEGEEMVGVLGHLDVVPLGEGWSKDPLGGEEEAGYIFGRGSSDDKGPTVAAYHALKILKDNNVKLNRRIRLIVGMDEESGFRCVEYYKQHEEIPNFGFVPDASFPVIFGEKGILQLTLSSNYQSIIRELNAGEVGNVVIGRASAKVSCDVLETDFLQYLKDNNLKGEVVDNEYFIEGKFAHAMAPFEGVNAGVFLLGFIGQYHQDKYAQVMYQLLHDYYGKGLEINFEGKHMGPLTMNLGILRVNEEHQSALIDIRFPDGNTNLEVIEKIKAKIAPLNIDLAIVADKDMVYIDPENEIIKILENVYREETGDYQSELITMGGGTYAKAFANHVAYGMDFPLEVKPDIVGDVHQADEAVSKDALIKAVAIYAKAIYKLANME